MPHGRTGIGTYTWQVVRRLPAADPETTYVAWYLDVRGALGIERRPRLFHEVRAPNLVDRRIPFPASWLERLSLRFDVPKLEWTERFDLLFAPNFVPPPSRTRRLVLTVHDLAFRRFPETAPLATERWRARLDAAIARAAQVIVPSEHTLLDLVELSGLDERRVTAIPLGVDADEVGPATAEAIAAVRRRYAIDGPYVLSLTGIEPRKNIPALIRAWASGPDDERPVLCLVGPVAPWNQAGWELVRPVIDALPEAIRRRIVVTGFVTEPDKVALLSGAEALLYPSLYEGFGLPVLEAMACGTPVLTSNVAALVETAGDAALLVDPHAPESIAEGMRRLLGDAGLRDTLRTRGLARAATFTWDETARRTAGVLRRAAD
jgi:glycosyltransferase involved in cell wall biosynthesis